VLSSHPNGGKRRVVRVKAGIGPGDSFSDPWQQNVCDLLSFAGTSVDKGQDEAGQQRLCMSARSSSVLLWSQIHFEDDHHQAHSSFAGGDRKKSTSQKRQALGGGKAESSVEIIATGAKTLRRSKTKVTGPNTKRKRTFKLRVFLIFLVLIVLSCLYIWQRVITITLSARTKELKLEIKQKQRTCKYLQIEVTKLSSVRRIEETGRKMGFVYPGLDQIGLIRESCDSTYLDKPGLTKKIWVKLKELQKDLLSGDQAIAKEIKREP
jgi:cell division protein FtsL